MNPTSTRLFPIVIWHSIVHNGTRTFMQWIRIYIYIGNSTERILCSISYLYSFIDILSVWLREYGCLCKPLLAHMMHTDSESVNKAVKYWSMVDRVVWLLWKTEIYSAYYIQYSTMQYYLLLSIQDASECIFLCKLAQRTKPTASICRMCILYGIHMDKQKHHTPHPIIWLSWALIWQANNGEESHGVCCGVCVHCTSFRSLAYGYSLYAIIIVAKNLRCKRAVNRRSEENNLRRAVRFSHPYRNSIWCKQIDQKPKATAW